MRKVFVVGFCLALWWAAGAAWAGYYKCVDGAGAVSYRDRPCTAGEIRQPVVVWTDIPDPVEVAYAHRVVSEYQARLAAQELRRKARRAALAAESQDLAARVVDQNSGGGQVLRVPYPVGIYASGVGAYGPRVLGVAPGLPVSLQSQQQIAQLQQLLNAITQSAAAAEAARFGGAIAPPVTMQVGSVLHGGGMGGGGGFATGGAGGMGASMGGGGRGGHHR